MLFGGKKVYTMCLLSHFSSVQLFVTPMDYSHQAPPPWNFPGKNTGVGWLPFFSQLYYVRRLK